MYKSSPSGLFCFVSLSVLSSFILFMRIKIFGFLFACFFCSALFAQVQSPEKFLGYKVGTRYTPHWKIVDYFKHVAAGMPDRVNLKQYGLTNEGRPLMLAFVGNTENIKNLEAIRLNNLRYTGLLNDRVAPNTSMPEIVWLSYNVHGNETSSSEASMLTLYSLLSNSTDSAGKWLANTVVIIDPCLNPDGRDRYVSWFNSVSGMQYDADRSSREHYETWPGGRTNHYYFDLNRDWAWQSQVETQQRMKVYNAWLPQVHVDFHEMGYESPYYFAPAAEPFHEVITPWQKEFQTMVGRNHAKYFDAKGWLYFTKIGYDLFYPSYGDTYPTYSGAIGMTFEQGGGGAGGLGVRTADGDTLTLVDRVQHHFVTSLSTIEACSANKDRLIREFTKFFSDASANGIGEIKTFVMRFDSLDWNRAALIKNYLRNNDIKWGLAGVAGSRKAFSYAEGREVQINIRPTDMVISSYQPKSALLKVLFEPVSKQQEVTNSPYDITAWSLPYAFGIETFGIRERLNPVEDKPAAAAPSPAPGSAGAYAYVLPWRDFTSAQALAKILRSGIRVRYAAEPFSVGGKNYPAGSLIVSKSANARFGELLFEKLSAATSGINNPLTRFEPVLTGFVDKGGDLGSNRVRLLEEPKVILITGEGVSTNSTGTIWQYFEQQLGYPVSLVNAANVSRIELGRYNTMIFAGGSFKLLGDKAFADQLKSWVSQGGKIITIGDGVGQFATAGWGIKEKKEEEKKETKDGSENYNLLKRYENREKESLATENDGTIYKVQLDNSHPLAFGYKETYYTLKSDGIFEFLKDGGWNVGVLKKDNYVSGFVGVKAKETLKDGLVFGVQQMGRGNIVYLADDVLFRGFWENGKLLFANALFMVD